MYFYLDMNDKAVFSVEANMTRLKTQILQEANDRLLIVIVADIRVYSWQTSIFYLSFQIATSQSKVIVIMQGIIHFHYFLYCTSDSL